MVSWIDGKLKAARNKGHLKNFGKTAPDTKGVKSIFKGRGNIEKAFRRCNERFRKINRFIIR